MSAPIPQYIVTIIAFRSMFVSYFQLHSPMNLLISNVTQMSADTCTRWVPIFVFWFWLQYLVLVHSIYSHFYKVLSHLRCPILILNMFSLIFLYFDDLVFWRSIAGDLYLLDCYHTIIFIHVHVLLSTFSSDLYISSLYRNESCVYIDKKKNISFCNFKIGKPGPPQARAMFVCAWEILITVVFELHIEILNVWSTADMESKVWRFGRIGPPNWPYTNCIPPVWKCPPVEQFPRRH